MLVKNLEQNKFTLNNFEGPLSFLLYLVQKSEIDISEISLQEILSQYIKRFEENQDPDVDAGGEFVSTTASLLWLKSKMLLPSHEQTATLEIEKEESPFTVLPQLIEYLHFKQISRELAEREQRQFGFYVRGHEFSSVSFKKPLGIEHISLEEFVTLFQQVLKKSHLQMGTIQEEEWRVSDKIASIKSQIHTVSKMDLSLLFAPARCREELIVIFLAILELMKLGEVSVAKTKETGELCLFARGQNDE